MSTNSCNFGVHGGKGAQGTTSAYYGVSGSGAGDVKRPASTELSDAPQQSISVQGNGNNIFLLNVGSQQIANYGVSGSGVGDVKHSASTGPSDAPNQSNAVKGNGFNFVFQNLNQRSASVVRNCGGKGDQQSACYGVSDSDGGDVKHSASTGPSVAPNQSNAVKGNGFNFVFQNVNQRSASVVRNCGGKGDQQSACYGVSDSDGGDVRHSASTGPSDAPNQSNAVKGNGFNFVFQNVNQRSASVVRNCGGKGDQQSACYGVSDSDGGDVKHSASTGPSDAPNQSNAVKGNGFNFVFQNVNQR